MKHRRFLDPSLARIAAEAYRLPVPADYFAGRRRPPVDVPDNILLFRRGSASELKDGTLQPHFHHRWVLIAALRGRGTVRVDGESHALGPGTMLLVPPLRLHRYEGVSRGMVCWLFITFELPAQDARSAKPTLGRLTRESRAFLAEALRAWNSGDASASVSARLAAQVALLLLALRRSGGTDPESRRPSATHDMLARINAWLASHMDSPARLATMARALGVSESHLRALFRDRHGISLGRYARETRCRLAALQLQRGDTSITEVAAACGFGSVYSFSRTFKRVLGITPGAMARQQPHRPAQAPLPPPASTRSASPEGTPGPRRNSR